MKLTKNQKIDLILFYCNETNKQIDLKDYNLPTDESILDDFVEVLITNDIYSRWIKNNRSNKLKMIDGI